MTAAAEALRRLPAVHACLADPPEAIRALEAGERLERAALERALAAVRGILRADPDALPTAADARAEVDRRWAEAVESLRRPALRRVVNATGVVVHTNLGRAPLAGAALEAARIAGERYVPLEYDLGTGERGSRYDHAVPLLRLASGAEDAVVVNNNAAALLVAVDSLAAGREVVVSRGELIEIGGGFRIHEILARSGASLVEVGATNRTHPEDYRRALRSGRVGAIVKVHRSNFAIEGFVAEVGLADLCELAREGGVPVVFDQGTGILDPLDLAPAEPTVRRALEAGATIVCASGDKLLGGPQAGLVFGRRDAIAAIRANPLLRALRVDKATLAALEATLRLALGDPAAIPVGRMITTPPAALERRARELVEALGPAARRRCAVARHAGRAGGGTLPRVELPGWAVRVEPAEGPDAFAARLREGAPAIVPRVADGAVWLDVRTFLPGDGEIVAARLDELLSGDGEP